MKTQRKNLCCACLCHSLRLHFLSAVFGGNSALQMFFLLGLFFTALTSLFTCLQFPLAWLKSGTPTNTTYLSLSNLSFSPALCFHSFPSLPALLESLTLCKLPPPKDGLTLPGKLAKITQCTCFHLFGTHLSVTFGSTDLSPSMLTFLSVDPALSSSPVISICC